MLAKTLLWRATTARGNTLPTLVRRVAQSTKKPVARVAVADEPDADKPVADKPVADKPVADKPVADEPVTKKPVANEAVANEADAHEPLAHEPLALERPPIVVTQPYLARKVWPPNFQELSYQQQLRLEKKYKRRLKLAHHSPKFEKGVKLAQLATITIALIWILMYSEFDWWGSKYKPSEEMRRHALTLFGVMDPDRRFERREDVPDFSYRTKKPGAESIARAGPRTESQPEPAAKSR